MLKDILDFASHSPTLAFLVFVLVVSWCFQSFNGFANRRHQRMLAAETHKRNLELLAKREALAARVGGAIELLMADTLLAGDFDTRLRIALDSHQKSLPSEEVGRSEPVKPVQASAAAER